MARAPSNGSRGFTWTPRETQVVRFGRTIQLHVKWRPSNLYAPLVLGPCGPGGMPTKTRLDPTAGGEDPPAGQDGAQGSGRGDHSRSVDAAAPAGGDVAGFIDSLTALASHLKEREAFESQARSGWARMSAWSALFIPLQVLSGYFAAYLLAAGAPEPPTTFLTLLSAGILTAGLAGLLFLRIAEASWRAAPDSVDRVALRHEDSPLRDRIRISQWILFDSALSRFAFNEQRYRGAVAFGVLSVSVDSMLAVALVPLFAHALSGQLRGWALANSAGLALFLVLALVSIVLTSKSAKAAFRLAQHYGRQVLAFDEDFGGFLPRAEREHVEKVVKTGGGKAEPSPEN